MAKRRTSSAQIVRAFPVRAPAQVIRIESKASPRRHSSPRAAKPKHHRRRHAKGGQLSGRTMMGAALGGAVLGFVDKSFPSLPTLPFIGRAGTIALGAFLLRNMGGGIGGILRDAALAGAAVAGYELGKEGHITGEIPSQVRGIASQV
jgi:hypothetical protein